ncbi:MAG: DUF4870 domain-containing protein [Blastocatellia bacterium]|nr:DUF4870 domain-containing protein [Blastocatellia bacterium]
MQAVSRDDRTWAMLAHLSALVGYSFIPFGNVVAPLIVWVIKKDQSWFIDDQAKEAMNFQISMVIYALISIPLVLLLIGIVLLIILYVFGIVMVIIAAIRANDGIQYRYPLTLRFIT